MPLSLLVFNLFHIHIYGAMIALGVCIFVSLVQRDKKALTLISSDRLAQLATFGIMAGVVGGKLLFAFEAWNTLDSWTELFSTWDLGFSILGTVIGVAIYLVWALRFYQLPFFALFDRIGLYAPIAQGFGRLGCFFAGCCYGIPTSFFTGVRYTDPESLAPLNQMIHPTQLYSAILLFSIFLFLYYGIQKWVRYPGQLFASYLFLISCERFLVDFLRDERVINFSGISLHQAVALALIAASVLLMYCARFTHCLRNSTQRP